MSSTYLILTPSTACSVVVVYKKRKVSSQPAARDDYTDMKYDVKTESVKAPRMTYSQSTSSSHQHYMKPPMTAVKPTKDIELKENEENPEDMYESV